MKRLDLLVVWVMNNYKKPSVPRVGLVFEIIPKVIAVLVPSMFVVKGLGA